MTWALCFSCGDTKFGAICPCPQCGVNSTGDIQLDILFSDHYMAVSTLEQFGKIVKLISQRAESKEERFWTFMFYVSENHSELLKIDLPEPIAPQIQRLYSQLEFPPVEISPGIRNRDDPSHENNVQDGEGKTEVGKQRKRWWQFWKK